MASDRKGAVCQANGQYAAIFGQSDTEYGPWILGGMPELKLLKVKYLQETLLLSTFDKGGGLSLLKGRKFESRSGLGTP